MAHGRIWYKSRRKQVFSVFFFLILIAVYFHMRMGQVTTELDITRRYIENNLEEALKEDKGMGCSIPVMDPFAPEVVQFQKKQVSVVCHEDDWVKCYMSECRVVPEIIEHIRDIVCKYRDIIHLSDAKYTLGETKTVNGRGVYTLHKSDHVVISCVGKDDSRYPIDSAIFFNPKWTGLGIGFRKMDTPTSPPGRENTINVLIFGFDSTSKNLFIRQMPKSYKLLLEELNATFLNGYNVVGDGTPASLFPILTGTTELELPDIRKSKSNSTLDSFPFIFYKLKKDGYRTTYFEDMPEVGTFQYRFNGFSRQPADHYLRSFFLEGHTHRKFWTNKYRLCTGDSLTCKMMMDKTEQFFKHDGKKFCFTFVADITHDEIVLSIADDIFVDFLIRMKRNGVFKNTLLMVMGDHGPRFANERNTLIGKLEERLPLMAIRLPEVLKKKRPDIQKALEANVNVLTTPHDIHATVLDAIDMKQDISKYKVRGADMYRAMSLLERVPINRSCSEAGIEAHWCSCLAWESISETDPLYEKAGKILVDHINRLTKERSNECEVRTIKSIEWVMKHKNNKQLILFKGAKDADGYIGKFGTNVKVTKENIQLQVVTNPGGGIYEATIIYLVNKDKFEVNTRDIQRINAYNDDPSCISSKFPHLNMFCYCKNKRIES